MVDIAKGPAGAEVDSWEVVSKDVGRVTIRIRIRKSYKHSTLTIKVGEIFETRRELPGDRGEIVTRTIELPGGGRRLPGGTYEICCTMGEEIGNPGICKKVEIPGPKRSTKMVPDPDEPQHARPPSSVVKGKEFKISGRLLTEENLPVNGVEVHLLVDGEAVDTFVTGEPTPYGEWHFWLNDAENPLSPGTHTIQVRFPGTDEFEACQTDKWTIEVSEKAKPPKPPMPLWQKAAIAGTVGLGIAWLGRSQEWW